MPLLAAAPALGAHIRSRRAQAQLLALVLLAVALALMGLGAPRTAIIVELLLAIFSAVISLRVRD